MLVNIEEVPPLLGRFNICDKFEIIFREFMEEEKGFIEIKMSAGWYMTVTMIKSDKFEEEKEYVEIAKVRGDKKRGRFNINPKYVRVLGDTLIKFADDNKL